jgi:nucleoside 2-deoxyribosyltransferase
MEDLLKIGFSVHCPHMNTAFMDGVWGKNDKEKWLEVDFEIIRRCDCIVMIPGWEKSEGAKAERKLAKELNIPVFYYPRDVVEMAMFADTTSTVR